MIFQSPLARTQTVDLSSTDIDVAKLRKRQKKQKEQETRRTPCLPRKGFLTYRIFELFDNAQASHVSKVVAFGIIFLIVLSSIAFIIETLPQNRYPQYGESELDTPPIFVWIETICVIIFTIEYVTRIIMIPFLTFTNDQNVKVNIGKEGLGHKLDPERWISASITDLDLVENPRRGGLEERWTIEYDAPEKNQLIKDTESGVETHLIKRSQEPILCIKQAPEWFIKLWLFFLQPLNLIDFLAILPFYIELFIGKGSGVGNKLTILRILRLLRVLRLFKLAKYVLYLRVYMEVCIRASSSFVIVFIFIGMSSMLTSALVFFCERGEWDEDEQAFMRWDATGYVREETPFKSIIHTFWWAVVTFTTTGYGDYYPTSPWGRVLGSITMILGVIGLAMPISAINQVFHEVMDEQKNKKETYENCSIDDRLQRVHKLLRRLNLVAVEVKWLHLAETALTEDQYITDDDEEGVGDDIPVQKRRSISTNARSLKEIELTNAEGKLPNAQTNSSRRIFTVEVSNSGVGMSESEFSHPTSQPIE